MPPRKNKVIQENVVESVYKTTIRYRCPKRGWVEEEVEVKRYKAPEPPKESMLEIESLEIEPQEEV